VSLHQRNSQIWSDLIASSVQENFCLVFSIASSVTKILANKIVSLYSIFFSKIWYLYRFKRYIFEYRCPPLPLRHLPPGELRPDGAYRDQGPIF
jgi:hypothetical protein